MPMGKAGVNSTRLFDLRGQVALITGAGAGFGEAIALGFAEQGCDIAAADLNLEAAQRTAAKGGRAGPTVCGHPRGCQQAG